jgi:hypothetical protein
MLTSSRELILMSEIEKPLPEKILAIKKRGYVIWASDDISSEFAAHFDSERIPVAGVKHVRVWGIQVDDERELPGHERTAIPDEELWQVELKAKDGSSYEISSDKVKPAPE